MTDPEKGEGPEKEEGPEKGEERQNQVGGREIMSSIPWSFLWCHHISR